MSGRYPHFTSFCPSRRSESAIDNEDAPLCNAIVRTGLDGLGLPIIELRDGTCIISSAYRGMRYKACEWAVTHGVLLFRFFEACGLSFVVAASSGLLRDCARDSNQ
jgi:hypothetical protein